MKPGEFTVRRIQVKEHGFTYPTFQVVGYLHGARIRRRFKSRDEALGGKSRLEVQAANDENDVRALNTRLAPAQLAEAETCFRRLDGKSLTLAVDWFLDTYRPPLAEKPLADAVADFVASRIGKGEEVHRDNVENKLEAFARAFPARSVHSFETPHVVAYLQGQGWGPKSQNNVRGILHSFFEYCAEDSRRWIRSNPVKAVPVLEVPRGLPEIASAERLAEMFAYLETYTGSKRCPHQPGFLVPYFGLATFAGIRPSVPTGEIWKLGHAPDIGRLVDTGMSVIRITPEIAKTDSVRQIKIRPNLGAWLKRYPLDKYPIVMEGMADRVTEVRKKFGLGTDVLRHTFISNHVAKWKSLGEAALEAGNSESIIRRHYLNLVSDEDADRFWGIVPGAI